jgi:hypothetical protein
VSTRAKKCPRCGKRQTVQGTKTRAAGLAQCINRDCGGFFTSEGPISIAEGLDRLGARQPRAPEGTDETRN